MPLDATTYLAPAVSEEAAIVRRMMELLATPDRWCQRGLRIGKAMCLMGALRSASSLDDDDWETISPHQDIFVAMTYECGSQGVPALFNDAPGRTHAEILAMLARVLRRFEG